MVVRIIFLYDRDIRHEKVKDTWNSQCCWHPQNALMLIKATFKDLLKIKRIRNYALKHDFYLYFPI